MQTQDTAASPSRVVVLAAGQGTNLRALLAAIDAGRLAARVVLVVSHRADAGVVDLARKREIPVRVCTLADVRAAGGTRDDLDARVAEWVLAARPDVVMCLGWMLILGPRFLGPLAGKVLNLHPALPGRFAGKDAIGQAWLAGQEGSVTETGVMVHEVTAELDGGRPVAWVRLPLDPSESLDVLTGRVHAAEHALVPAALASWLGRP